MAVEFVGGAIASAFFEAVVDKLASPETIKYFENKSNKNMPENLSNTLTYITTFVDDAERHQIRNPRVKDWLDNVKRVILDAEDTIDEILCQMSKQAAKSSTRKVLSLFNFSSFDEKVKSDVEEILTRLDFLRTQKDVLNLKGINTYLPVGSGSTEEKRSTSFPARPLIYGRDNDIGILFDWMKSDTSNVQFSMLSLVGMGGIGKSTVAKHLFHHPGIEEFFDLKAWIHVSSKFDKCRLVRDAIEEFTHSASYATSFNMLQQQLAKILIRKKVFIVLDDIWNEDLEEWFDFFDSFINAAWGSKILVTTRSKKVALIMSSAEVHQLEQLDDESSWKLFAKSAFQDKGDSDLEEVGRKVIEKCRGLPLALKALGHVLRGESSEVLWQRILDSEIWDIPQETKIIPALMISYRHLPSHLKKCFAYCALFPKGFLFDKSDLSLLWFAENLLTCPRRRNESMQETAEKCFNDLLLRSFFQPSMKYETHFIMHDLVHDLAKYVSGNLCFTLKAEEDAHNIPEVTRHFALLCDERKSYEGLNTLFQAKRLRTFLPLNVNSGQQLWSMPMLSELFSDLVFLRVLSLNGCLDLDELPDTIGKLKLLRHLDLSRTRIRKLPHSFCSLHNLQILKLRDCHHFEEFPLNFHQLINLCYLDFSGTRVRTMPSEMGKLKKLEVLNSFYVNKSSESNIKQLKELDLHGKLSILELQNVVNSSDASSANMALKVNLVELELIWNSNRDDSQNDREILDRLQPSRNLKILSIENYVGTLFSSWFGGESLSKVVSLKLKNCKHCILLPSLGTLKSLKHLQIIGLTWLEVIGREFYGNETGSSTSIPFPSLETLTFKKMNGWEKWECKEVDRNAFPRLQKLSVVRCPNLKGKLPEKLPCLVSLKIFDCKQLVASIQLSSVVSELLLIDCGKLQFEHRSSTLKFLEICRCKEGSSVEWIGNSFSECGNSIKSFKIEDCPGMSIPLDVSYSVLVKLDISSSCDSLTTFPLDLFPTLDSLDIYQCNKFARISQEQEHLKLSSLTIEKCPKFTSFPKGGLSAPKLRYFNISELESLESLSECMHTLLPSLSKLSIKDCPQLVSFCDGGLPSGLRNLSLVKCSNLLVDSLKWAFPTNPSLCDMSIENVDVEAFPNQGLLPPSLTHLTINCCQNLKQLDYMGLSHLPSLTTLNLHNCPNIQCLPEEGLPRSISNLQIRGDCSLLKQRCSKRNGEDWRKIAQIENLFIDS